MVKEGGIAFSGARVYSIGVRRLSRHRFRTMNDIIQTMLNQAGGIGPICAMTGAQIIYDNDTNSATLHFKRQAGKKKISHLKLIYNSASDLYDLKGYRYNKKTFACPEVWSQSMVYADGLKKVCEDVTGLYFTL